MKIRFALAIVIALLAALPAQAINLNNTSDLVNQGVEPAPSPKTVLNGIPLMEGLQPAEDTFLDVVPEFSAPLPPTATAIGIIDVDDIYNFYKRALPPLGWQPTGSRDYTKDGHALHINAHADGKRSTVTFTLQ